MDKMFLLMVDARYKWMDIVIVNAASTKHNSKIQITKSHVQYHNIAHLSIYIYISLTFQNLTFLH